MSIAKLLPGAIAVALSLACAGSYAGSSPVAEFSHSSSVRIADLDLSRSRDIARLYGRITVAADQVCGPRSLTGAYAKAALYHSCYADAVAQAVARVNHPGLTAYFRQRWPEPVSVAQQ